MKKLIALLVAMMMLVMALPAMAETAIDTSEHVTVTYLVTGDIPTNRTEEVLAKINEILSALVADGTVAAPQPELSSTGQEP